jgi:predicted extracellular nuclease
MDIFNRKKVKQLEAELSKLNVELLRYKKANEGLQLDIRRAKDVQEVKHIVLNEDAVALANHIKSKCVKRGRCSNGRCGFIYHVPAEMLDIKK